MKPSYLSFRKQARATTPGEIRLIREAETALAELSAGPPDGIPSIQLINYLNIKFPEGSEPESELPIKQLLNLARRGLFKHVAVQSSETVMRYGKAMRPWRWYAPGFLPVPTETNDPLPPIVDASARLDRLAEMVYQARKESNAMIRITKIYSAALKAVEGILPEEPEGSKDE
jgi:hypothetical protein